MNRRAELLDVEAQISDAQTTSRRTRRHDADRHDRRTLVRVGGVWMDADLVPDRADVADLEDHA